jgi:hypothetical protein
MCKTCKKITWAGCGQHIEQALAGVPKENRCMCNRNAKPESTSSASFINRLFGIK